MRRPLPTGRDSASIIHNSTKGWWVWILGPSWNCGLLKMHYKAVIGFRLDSFERKQMCGQDGILERMAF